MATAVDPNLPPLFSNIRYSLEQTIKEPARNMRTRSQFHKFITF
jgi:hypothetical protein